MRGYRDWPRRLTRAILLGLCRGRYLFNLSEQGRKQPVRGLCSPPPFSAWQRWGQETFPASDSEFSWSIFYTPPNHWHLSMQPFMWQHGLTRKACLPSPSEHTMVNQLLKACRWILNNTWPKIRKTPLAAIQVKEILLKLGQGKSGHAQCNILMLCNIPPLGWPHIKTWGAMMPT